MKLFNLKTILILIGFIWVALSFLWFSQKQTHQALITSAEKSLEFTKLDLIQKSKDLRFKLGQWGYNYQLVKTKGSDFDQDSFMASEFESIYFFKLEDNEFKPQWSKSKDLATVAIPKSIKSKLKAWTKEKLETQDFLYFSDDPSPKGSKVFFGFMIKDESMGEGLLLSSLDFNYVQLIPTSLNVYLIDTQGRFLSHPRREYIGQSASRWLTSETKNMFTKSMPAGFISAELIYKQKIPAIMSQAFVPTFVMFLGLMLIFGVLIFDIYMSSPFNSSIKSTIVQTNCDSNGSGKDNYASVLKLNEVRESLNKMSLLSSALKGRLDLASLEKADQTLFSDIKSDFEQLDQMLDSAYKVSQNNNFNETAINNIPDSVGMSVDNKIKINSNSPFVSQFNFDDTAKVSELSAGKKVDPKVNQNSDLLSKELEESLSAMKSFDDQDFNFEIGLEEFDLGETEFDDEMLDDELNIGSSHEEINQKGVVFQEYIGADSESNDWAKIIEELTDEINTAPLKPTQSQNVSGS